MLTLENKVCPICGVIFQPRDYRQKQCSRKCSKKAWCLVRPSRAREWPILSCEYCNQKFQAKTGRSRFCSDKCYAAAYRAENLELCRARNRESNNRRYQDSEKREKILAANKRWKERNLERWNEYHRQYEKKYQIDNAERLRENARIRYWMNPEKYREKARAVMAKRDPERKREATLKHYYNNHIEIRRQRNCEYDSEYRKTYYKLNRQRELKAQKSYYKENRAQLIEAAKIRNHKRRAVGILTAATYRKIIQSSDGKCFYCKNESANLTIDHFVPVSFGGTNSEENLVAACKSCNSSKGDRIPVRKEDGSWLFTRRPDSQTT